MTDFGCARCLILSGQQRRRNLGVPSGGEMFQAAAVGGEDVEQLTTIGRSPASSGSTG